MNVVALVDFFDRERMVDRKRGEEFIVSKARFEAINAVGQERIGSPIVEEVVRTVEAKGVQTPESRKSRRGAGRKSK